ncbi:MAG TPA: peptidoglycan-associated lipoprotein Pal [Bacteroidetes bacterium]|nr:peptidoglycan-associated lipoprotein precursor [bacterium BMS3Bbin04]HDO65030.1 peptidoglycan-associated lipoprotein Pal [Bacteroidota bacterium]HEX04155.1 peptidoglycan-associated lipoprotein Pal [Bacteroidota bacterium]
MKHQGKLVLIIMIIAAFSFAGCASKQQETPPIEEIPIDTTGFQQIEPEPIELDTLPSVEELEQRRLEELRLVEQQQQQEENRNRQSLKVVYFEYDQSSLSAETREALRFNAEMLRRYPGWKVMVEGHCDERGSTEYNLALGERRAASAKQYYIDYGIDASRIRLLSYGEERPAVTGSSEAAWAKNRRAVTVTR